MPAQSPDVAKWIEDRRLMNSLLSSYQVPEKILSKRLVSRGEHSQHLLGDKQDIYRGEMLLFLIRHKKVQAGLEAYPQFYSAAITPPHSRDPQLINPAHYTPASAATARKAMASSAACAGFFFFDAEPLGKPSVPTLNACVLCAKRLERGSDIFIEDCRDVQMQLDAPAGGSMYSSGTDASSGQQHHESRKLYVASDGAQWPAAGKASTSYAASAIGRSRPPTLNSY
ncbi:hypothetical protein HU200_063243 [Digitaria exilis]|uniref:Uncharacterized protein n=1 Tax=Digitaria exilis TaxID=1010633 RepID=A0A835ADY7_9POAL|nr:hypothetical protein HU200_063243 [Digitaria exilis]